MTEQKPIKITAIIEYDDGSKLTFESPTTKNGGLAEMVDGIIKHKLLKEMLKDLKD